MTGETCARALCAAIAPIWIACCAAPAPTLAPVSPAAASALPPLEFRLVSGGTWTSQSSLSQVIVLDVWATYCKPCRKAFPKLGALAAGRADLVVIGVSVDDDDSTVSRFLREVPTSFPIARDPERTVETGPLGVRSLPTVLVVDRRGRVRLRLDKMAEADYDALPAIVDALLAE